MAENNNTTNNNQSQYGRINSQNNIPPRPQSLGNRPNIPPRSQSLGNRPNIPPRPMGSMLRSGGINNSVPRQNGLNNIPPRQVMSPRQPNINPRTNRPDVNAGQSQRIGGNLGQNINRMPQQGNAINGNANRISANDRFDRGTKHLSHIGGGAGAKLYRINKAEDDMSRRKVGGIMLDADIIQDANQQKLDDSKNKRKNVIIIVLSMLLAISLAYLAIAIFGYVQNSKAENCRYNISTEVPAYWLIEGGRETKFAVREGLRSNTVYEINTCMVIESDDYVDIEVIITVTVNGKEIYISGLYEASDNMVRVENKNTWKYIGGHQGAGEVYLFGGLDFFGAPDGLNSTSVNINIYAEVTRVDN